MNRICMTTTVEARKDQVNREVILNRELLYTKDAENLYIKYNDELIPIGGECKQNKLTAGDNIEIIRDRDENDNPILPEVIRLSDDIYINTCTLHPDEEGVYDWKGTIKLGELGDGNTIFLFTKRTEVDDVENACMLGGEILVKIIVDEDENEVRYAHYTLTCTSTGSWSLKGAAEMEAAVRMVRAKWENEWYYGIKLPLAVVTHYAHRTRSMAYRLRVGTSYGANRDRNHLEVIDSSGNYIATFVDTGYTAAGNTRRHYQYIPLDAIIPALPYGWRFQDLDMQDYYGKGYYLYFDITYQNNNGTHQLRFLSGCICNQAGAYDPYAEQYANRRIVDIGTLDTGNFDWNDSMMGSYVYANGNNNYTLDFVTTTYNAEEYTTETVPFERAEIWFNGWQHLPLQPFGYRDADIEYVVLSDTSHDNESFAETFQMSADETIAKIPVLHDTGEDNAPYRFIITGTINKSQLLQIAALCRDPEEQIYLDLSNATVAQDARDWNDYIFRGCSSLRGLILPKGVTRISECCFVWCTYLRYLDFSPSAGTLTSIGADSGWSTSIGLLTSTRVRDLILPASVNRIGKYLIGSSNIERLIFLHTGMNPVTVEQWSFMIIDPGGNTNSSLPDDFHMYVTESWWNGYLADRRRSGTDYQYQWNNNAGWWTPAMVSSIVTYNPDWSQEEWQSFADMYKWTEDLVNEVRARFGHPDAIEIKELNIIN